MSSSPKEESLFRLRAVALAMDPSTLNAAATALATASSLADANGGAQWGPAVMAAVTALRAVCGTCWSTSAGVTDTSAIPEAKVADVHLATLTVLACSAKWTDALTSAQSATNGHAVDAALKQRVSAALGEVVARERVLAIACAAATKQPVRTTALCTRCAAQSQPTAPPPPVATAAPSAVTAVPTPAVAQVPPPSGATVAQDGRKAAVDPATHTRPSPAPASSASKAQCPYDYLLVLDFECTCKEDDHSWPNEIIEFPIVAVDTKTATYVGEFHTFVKPVLNPKLTAFCTKLTGITQAQVDAGKPLGDVIKAVTEWVDHIVPAGKTFAFATDGPWDLREFFYRGAMCRDGHTAPPYFLEWVDVRNTCAVFHHVKPEKLPKQLQRLGLKFQGREHSGMDDTRNIAHITTALLRKGCAFWSTSAVEKQKAKRSSRTALRR